MCHKPTAEREYLLDVGLVGEVARGLLEHKVVQGVVLLLGPHEGKLVDHASILVLESGNGVGRDGLPPLHLDHHLCTHIRLSIT